MYVYWSRTRNKSFSQDNRSRTPLLYLVYYSYFYFIVTQKVLAHLGFQSSFNHLSKWIHKQMTPHFKALIKSFKNQKRNFLLNSVRSSQDRDSSSVKTTFNLHVIGLFFEVFNSFLSQLAYKLRAIEVWSPEKVPGKGAFYYINHHNSGTFSGLTDSTACNFEASWGRKELYTSKENPITCRLKAVLKLEESLLWEAPDEF